MTPKQLREILKEELKPIIVILGKHSKILEKHTRQIEDIIAELHEVHKLAGMTSDIVMARYEKNKREIDEIKDHLGLPKEPYFAE